MRFSFWLFLWETFEFLYFITGLRWQRPIEYFKPDFCEWLFHKMTGLKGTLVENKKDKE